MPFAILWDIKIAPIDAYLDRNIVNREHDTIIIIRLFALPSSKTLCDCLDIRLDDNIRKYKPDHYDGFEKMTHCNAVTEGFPGVESAHTCPHRHLKIYT
jgi:hypothetical protein